MKKIKKPVFFIVFTIIALFSVSVFTGVYSYYGDIKRTYIKGVSDIRLGIDIQGGVDVTFTSSDDYDATDEQLDAASAIIKQRLTKLSINDSETYIDYAKDRIIVRFPWQAGETDFDPEKAVSELGETAMLTFREGKEMDSEGKPTGVTESTIILQGQDVTSATVQPQPNQTTGKYEDVVVLKLSDEGKQKFAEATARLATENGVISIWMDDTCVSAPTVQSAITDGEAVISGGNGGFADGEAKELADKINSGALPFKLVTSSFKTISPTLGTGALDAMVLSGIVAFAIIAIYIIVLYKLPGVVAVIALVGQIAGMLCAISRYFGFMPSATLTIPGIAGIILSVGMGVDANIITSERIKEEINNGRSLETALKLGYKRASSAIIDGNLTIVIVAIVLMGAFGTPDSVWYKLFSWAFRWFPSSTEGTVYSFGYTLLVGVIMNFIMGVTATKLMTVSLSRFKPFKNKKLYGYKGGETNE